MGIELDDRLVLLVSSLALFPLFHRWHLELVFSPIIQILSLRCFAPTSAADNTPHSASNPSEAKSPRTVPSPLLVSIGLFSTNAYWGRTSPIILAMCFHIELRLPVIPPPPCLLLRCPGMEILQIRHQQFLAKVFRQRFAHHPKSGKSGEFCHFVWRTIRLLGIAPTRLHRLFSIQGDVPQVFLHQRLRKEPTHSHLLFKLFNLLANPCSPLLPSFSCICLYAYLLSFFHCEFF